MGDLPGTETPIEPAGGDGGPGERALAGPGRSRPGYWACWAGSALIFAVTLLAYWPALHGAPIWNDADYITAPHLRSAKGLWAIWFKLGATQQYYPLLHTFFWIEHRLWGDSALGYHLANVGLHALAASLLVMVLRSLWPWRHRDAAALFAGLLFALHPLCVESVAWISEQKNTLSLVFYLGAGAIYLRGVCGFGRGEEAAGRRFHGYGAASLLFLAALLSKPVTATLPAAILVVLWWKRGSLQWRRDVVPLLPWFLIGAASGLFSAWVERTYIGARGSAFELGFAQRLVLSGRIIWFYLGKILWPANLIFIYPRWRIDASEAWQWLFIAGAIALALLLWSVRGRSRGPLAAYLFFAGSLFPTLGFLNVYAFIFSFVADHWQYLPSIGILALAAAGWGKLLDRSERGQVYYGAAAGILLLCGALTWRQSRMYDDMETFYETTLRKNPGCWMAHNNLGNLLRAEGHRDLALQHLRMALALKPDLAEAHNNLGAVLRESGHSKEAIAEFRRAVKENPKFADAYANLGVTLGEQGDATGSCQAFETALRLAPYLPNSHNGYAVVLAALGRNREAEAQLKEAIRLDPALSSAYSNLANVYCQEGNLPASLPWYEKALRLEPKNVEVRDDYGVTLAQIGRLSDALAQFEIALKENPKSAESHYHIYLVLMSLGRPDEAFTHFHEARRLDPNVGRQN